MYFELTSKLRFYRLPVSLYAGRDYGEHSKPVCFRKFGRSMQLRAFGLVLSVGLGWPRVGAVSAAEDPATAWLDAKAAEKASG
jgi:hypothetical protein